MPYPFPFHHMVAIGKLYSEDFNFSLNIVPIGFTSGDEAREVTPALLTAVAGAVGTWFDNATPSGLTLTAKATLVSLKLNLLGTDGKYMRETNEHIYPTPIPGFASSGNPVPQNTLAVTLTTAIPRGRGSKGRFYPPPSDIFVSIGTDGRIPAANAGQYALGAKALLDAVNAAYSSTIGAGDPVMRVGVASNRGSGTFAEATGVQVGRVIDTMRSRRTKLLEDHQSATLAVAL